MKATMWRWSLALAALAGAGCGNGIPANTPVQQRLALTNFNSCNDLQKYIQDTAVLDMRSQLEAAKKGYGYFPYGLTPGVANAGAPQAAGAAAGPTAYTTTNTQVAGVDEADFVKNDGTRIFVLSGDTLYANTSWPADQLSLQGKLQIEGWPREMFLDASNHVVVFSTLWDSIPFDNRGYGIACGPDGWYCGFYWANTTKVTVVDVSDLTNLKVTSETFLPGYYNNSRRINSQVRIVLGDDFRWPDGVRFYPDFGNATYPIPQPVIDQAYDKLMAANEVIIRATTYDQWLPPAYRKLADGSVITVPYQCSDFYKSNAPTKLGLATVATLDLANPTADITRTSIVAEVGQIYASTTSLYLATEHWWWWWEPGQVDHTYLYKFDISQPDKAPFVAAGGVDGHIADQFSMDEDANGFFRIVTNIGTRVPSTTPGNWWGDMQYTNKLYVLAEQSGNLNTVGTSNEIAPGELLHGSRFLGNRGFITTAVQMDPLWTFDLTDPTHPTQVGQLQVPGWSSYLHPIDANHILAIGEYVSQTSQGEFWSVQLNLFDVTDLKNPKLQSNTLVGSGYNWSEAQWDHHAFNYFPETGLLAIPYFDWNSGGTCSVYWDCFSSDLRVFAIDPKAGSVSQKGALDVKDVYVSFNDDTWDFWWAPMVRRSVMATDAAGNVFVYAIFDGGIRSANLSSITSPLKTQTFDIATR